jgi:hypothetical protein
VGNVLSRRVRELNVVCRCCTASAPHSCILGGMSFIESPEIAYLLSATRALAFHPPSRAAAAGPIARYLAGGPLNL